MSGCIDFATGQAFATVSNSFLSLSDMSIDGICRSTITSDIRLGLDTMILVISEVTPVISIPLSRALMPIIVIIQLGSAVATKSVGEKASPLPLLSVGASVIIRLVDFRCVASVLRLP